jgi:hypothetical protein
MEPRAQKYRERALDCEYLADTIRDPVCRLEMIEARQWRELAKQDELLDKLSVGAQLA